MKKHIDDSFRACKHLRSIREAPIFNRRYLVPYADPPKSQQMDNWKTGRTPIYAWTRRLHGKPKSSQKHISKRQQLHLNPPGSTVKINKCSPHNIFHQYFMKFHQLLFIPNGLKTELLQNSMFSVQTHWDITSTSLCTNPCHCYCTHSLVYVFILCDCIIYKLWIVPFYTTLSSNQVIWLDKRHPMSADVRVQQHWDFLHVLSLCCTKCSGVCVNV